MSIQWDRLRIDKQSPMPMYYQLKQGLEKAIADMPVGSHMPTEMELCEHLCVSRPTVRQALSALVNEGRLTRQRGRGTVVSTPKVEAHFLNRLQSFNEEMLAKGLVPSTDVLALRKRGAIPEVNAELCLQPEEELLLLRRVRRANGTPLVWVDSYLPYQRCEALLAADFTKESLYALLESSARLRVARVARRIEAGLAKRADADALGVAVGAAILEVRTIGTTAENLPVEYSIAHYRGDQNSFTVELYR